MTAEHDWMGEHPEAFCWAPNDDQVACDRVKDHLGPHSWEPWQDDGDGCSAA